MEYVELSTDKLYGLTQHRVWLIVTVCLQEGGHYVHKPTEHDIHEHKQVFTNAHVIYTVHVLNKSMLKRCIIAHIILTLYVLPVHVS